MRRNKEIEDTTGEIRRGEFLMKIQEETLVEDKKEKISRGEIRREEKI